MSFYLTFYKHPFIIILFTNFILNNFYSIIYETYSYKLHYCFIYLFCPFYFLLNTKRSNLSGKLPDTGTRLLYLIVNFVLVSIVLAGGSRARATPKSING